VPSVILRGAPPGPCNHDGTPCKENDVDNTYLVRFDRSVMTYGGVQYQQLAEMTSPITSFEFLSCTTESTDGPLFDIVTDPSLKVVRGFEQIVVRHELSTRVILSFCTFPCCHSVGIHSIRVYRKSGKLCHDGTALV
jgi:hypothetical protein